MYVHKRVLIASSRAKGECERVMSRDVIPGINTWREAMKFTVLQRHNLSQAHLLQRKAKTMVIWTLTEAVHDQREMQRASKVRT